MKRLLGKVLSTSIAHFINLSGSTLCVIVFNYFYGAENLGIFSIVMATILLVSIFFKMGTPVLLLRQFAIKDQKSPEGVLAAFVRMQFLTFPYYRNLVLAAIGVSGFLWATGRSDLLIWVVMFLPIILFVTACQMLSNYFRCQGRTALAAMLDVGFVYMIILATLLVAFGLLGFTFSQTMVTIGVVFLALLLIAIPFQARLGAPAPIEVKQSDSYNIVLNSLLVYAVRNGYVLIFAIFLTAAQIGEFRLEERLCYTLSVTMVVFKILGTKFFLRNIRERRSYRGYMVFVFQVIGVVTVLAVTMGAALYLVTRIEPLMTALRLEQIGPGFAIMILGSVCHVISTFIIYLHNLRGSFKSISLQMLVSAAAFMGLSYLWYSAESLDGVRYAYLVSGIIALGVGIVFILLNGPEKEGDGTPPSLDET